VSLEREVAVPEQNVVSPYNAEAKGEARNVLTTWGTLTLSWTPVQARLKIACFREQYDISSGP